MTAEALQRQPDLKTFERGEPQRFEYSIDWGRGEPDHHEPFESGVRLRMTI